MVIALRASYESGDQLVEVRARKVRMAITLRFAARIRRDERIGIGGLSWLHWALRRTIVGR
jgi:hypothetical protein